MIGQSGPISVANLTAAAGVVIGDEGWWPCLNLTWRTPVPGVVTRLVAQVRERGSDGPPAETVVTPNDGAASVVNGVSVGQHLQVRLAPAGAPGLPFQPTPWLDVTTPWDALIAQLDGLKVGCFTIVCGVGVPTRTDLPTGSLYVREDVSQLWQYKQGAGVALASGVNIVGTDLKTGTNIVTLSGYTTDQVLRFSKPLAAASGGLLTWDAYSGWPNDLGTPNAHGPPAVAGQTYTNNVSIYGNNGGGDVLLFAAVLSGTLYVDAAAAYAALAAQLPITVTGYATYKVVGEADPYAVDNRGGLSILVEELAGWVLISNLTSIRQDGVEIEDQPRSLDFLGAEVETDGDGGVTVRVIGPYVDVTASEALSARNVVSFHSSSGAKVRKANATDDTKQADGFVLAAVANGDTARVYLPGSVITGLAALTPGALYFLHTTGGAITLAVPGSGWSQIVGRAATATELVFFPRPGENL
jgi:hypothetical protein